MYMLSVQLHIARNRERESYTDCVRVYSVLNEFRAGVDGVSVRERC